MSTDTSESVAKAAPRPRRADIETYCLLTAVGTGGCPAHDLAERLGLSPTLAAAVGASTRALEDAGLVIRVDDVLARTEEGNLWLSGALHG